MIDYMSLYPNEDVLTKKKLNQSFAEQKYDVISLILLSIPRIMYTADSVYVYIYIYIYTQ